MSLDCYAATRARHECEKVGVTLGKHFSELKLFEASQTLELVTIDILGELRGTSRGNRSLLLISDRCLSVAPTVPLRSIAAEDIAQTFVWY